MDEKISRWIVEFLVRQSVDDCIVENLLSSLPLRDDDFLLKKALLLRKVRAEVANATVSEKVLDFLQLIADMEFGQGMIISETMKTAYCAVAVDCTVRFLEEEMENDGKYLGCLKRIWRGRVQRMETSENSGLVSENLRRWKNDLEAASSDVELRVKILSRNTRNEALKAVKRYLAEAWGDMGPTFLEKVAENEDKMEKVGQQDKGVQVSENDEFADSPPHLAPVSNEAEIDSNGGQMNAGDCHNMSLNETGLEKGNEGVKNAVEPQDGMVSSDKPAMDGLVEIDMSVQEPIPIHDPAPESPVNGVKPVSIKSTGDGSSAAAKPDGEQSLPLQGSSKVEPQDGMVSSDKPAMDDIVENDMSVQEPIPRRDPAPESLVNGVAPTSANITGDGSSTAAKPDGEQSLSLRGPSTETVKVSSVRYKHVPLRSRAKRHRPTKIVDLEEMDKDTPADKTNEIRPPEASGSHEGHDPKKAPLSDTPHVEPAISAGAEVQNTQVAPESPREAQAVNTPVENADCIQQKDATMKDAEGDGDASKRRPGEEGPNSPGKATLVQNKSPAAFKKEDLGESSAGMSSPRKRKAKRRWTSLEEDTLREGVKKFGRGNWKFILYANRDAFQGRTEVDLKDKWRNMMK